MPNNTDADSTAPVYPGHATKHTAEVADTVKASPAFKWRASRRLAGKESMNLLAATLAAISIIWPNAPAEPMLGALEYTSTIYDLPAKEARELADWARYKYHFTPPFYCTEAEAVENDNGSYNLEMTFQKASP